MRVSGVWMVRTYSAAEKLLRRPAERQSVRARRRGEVGSGWLGPAVWARAALGSLLGQARSALHHLGEGGLDLLRIGAPCGMHVRS